MNDYALLGAIDLSAPGRYVHWSIFSVSEANLVLVAVMVLIFGAALLLRFPGKENLPPDASVAPARGESEGLSSLERDMWTHRLRRFATRLLPPEKLLPDRQPAYVASWIYVFGVASLAALGVAIVSGGLIALGGVDWWHTNAIGHFFNSCHLWSVELFMAFVVIHLWGKFWMAAWRGRRVATWMTGVVAFLASIVECFTGYLSQQNFDAQWISTNGKDAINATGLGGFFNLMNFGQMLLWHVVLVPIALVALVGAHILFVRMRGVVRPLTPPELGLSRRARAKLEAEAWTGPTRRYDIVKEAAIATVISLVLVIALAGILSSPDVPPVTVATWARVAPADFMATAATELAGTSETATYGPPYGQGDANLQRLGISWQSLAGVRTPIDPAATFVLSPLSKVASSDAPLAAALRRYKAATSAQQSSWNQAYLRALDKATIKAGTVVVPAALDGPVRVLIASELRLAQSGALDADLLAQQPFYGTNFTKPLLFLEDGSYFAQQAHAQHLTGSQWGVMNETGSFPGQPWLWLYTMWYQLPGFRSSANVDLIAVYLTGLATLLLLLVPFIPGLRDIPRMVPIHRLIWRSWYRGRKQVVEPPPARAGGE